MRGTKQFVKKIYHLILLIKVILRFCWLVMFLPNVALAQVYFDVPVQFDFYKTTSENLDFGRRGVIINPLVGIVVAGDDSSKFEAHLGLGIFYSKFNQDVGGSKFEFNALGPIQTSFTGYYKFSKKFQAGIGVSFGWFGVFEKGLNINTDPEYPDRLGDGYKSVNFGNSAEIRYNINGRFSLGAKYTYWYLPQLEYKRIGDFGEFEEPQRDLYLTRLEFSIRVFVTPRNYTDYD